MECDDEEAAQESTRRGAQQITWFGPKRDQTAGQSRKWHQGWWPGQKPQPKTCRPAQGQTPTTCTPEDGLVAAVTEIRSRFGYTAIGLGYSGIRYSAAALR